MGQSAKKNKFFKTFEDALLKYSGTFGSEGHTTEVQVEAFLDVCRVIGTRWQSPDSEFQLAFRRALTSPVPALRQALLRFFDVFLSSTWPREDARGEYELTLSLVVQVLPSYGDVIGEFDDVSTLATQLAAQLGVDPQSLQIDKSLHELTPYQGWSSICSEVAFAKTAAQRKPSRPGMRFSTEVAVAPVVRHMWVTVTFPDEAGAASVLDRMRQGQFFHPPLQASLPYTVKAVMEAAQETCQAGVLGLYLGLPLSSAVQWAFYEGDLELQAALKALASGTAEQPQNLHAKVVVAAASEVSLPEGVVGAERASEVFGKGLPEVQVLFYRKSPRTSVLSAAGRVLYCRAAPDELEPALQSLIVLLARHGIQEVEVVRPSLRKGG